MGVLRWGRVLLTVVGLSGLALFVWFAGPYFAFGEFRPLESQLVRRLVIAFMLLAWGGWWLFQRYRAKRASDQLMHAVVEQSEAEPPNAEVVQLREKFEDAVAALKKDHGVRQSLYDLPWYLIIGAPGSGKTTALVNSGLRFPAEQRMGRGALRGVGGTRSCDWWFTDEAVFLDTAGRYTTQDSDANADSAAWAEFLTLLCKYRERRPVNGVILTISASDLVLHGEAQIEAHIAAARRRLDELGRQLDIKLPVYVLVTKCDLVSGFSEYFEDLTREGRAQVWGTTFDYEHTLDGTAAQSFVTEFDRLVGRLNTRLLTRVEDETDPGRRTRMFAFPQQFATLRDQLDAFIGEVFDSTRFERQILLRGVYFTSGTQEGTPIDRLLGAIGRRFALASQIANPQEGQGKAYFIDDLFQQVILPESGLAGVNQRLETRSKWLQYAAVAVVSMMSALFLFGFTRSHGRNSQYLGEVGAATVALQEVPPVYVAAYPEALLPRLGALSAVVESADRFRDDAPFAMTWGLYQGNAVGDAAREAYVRELTNVLLPQVVRRVQERLVDYVEQPTDLYLFLKAYLMLGNPERLDTTELEYILNREWATMGGSDPYGAAALSMHFHNLLELADRLPPMPLDESLIAQTRSALELVSIPEVMFHELSFAYAIDSRTLRLDEASGAGAALVLRRSSGGALSDPLPALYTKPVFMEVTSEYTSGLEQRYREDRWVWGDQEQPLTATRGLEDKLIAIYEREYIAHWDALVRDIEPAITRSQLEREELLMRLSAPTSPLRGLLTAVDEHTFLVAPEEPAPGGIRGRAAALLERGRATVGVTASPTPGAEVTAHFAELHDVVAGARSAELDELLGQLGAIQQQLSQLGPDPGDYQATDPEAPAIRAEIRDLTRVVRRLADGLPEVLRPAVGKLADVARGGPSPGPAITSLYQEQVVSVCQRVMGRYPFIATGGRNDVTLSEFGQLFGSNGTYDTFFRAQLDQLVDRTRVPWRWRPNSGMSSPGMLRAFEAANQIRESFFSGGGQMPALSFDLEVLELTGPENEFGLTIGAQPFDYMRGSELPRGTGSWPSQPGGAGIRFGETRNETAGAWAWFKVLEKARRTRVTDARYELDFWNGPNTARVRVEAASRQHPVAALNMLRRFRCG